ncbi:sulfotransferase family protein [Shewanella sp. VB17]|uniref:sulfotransferase n=1 Tax=Shewanella sp. VB17 TaxID=2739432 RepID=UPI001565E743|nr:sulfotransferase [Shewanella sp. VB17]NRD71916.1 sulfotransferase family protein [Shewanella sp. VB17]
MTKFFIIGLPRTGTTSVSVALLEHGFKVAHQAFTKQAFELADVISDAPCFSDYKQLDYLYSNAKFIYLDRSLESWVPSMQMLLSRMLVHLDEKKGRFHPILKRSFKHSFGVGEVDEPTNTQHLMHCYQAHKKNIFDFFSDRNDFTSIDVSKDGALSKLLDFMNVEDNANFEAVQLNFPHLNSGRRVASWDEYKHPNKISANAAGPEKRKYFDYKLIS